MTDSEIIKQCSYNYNTHSWIWVGHFLEAPEHPIDMEGRATVLLSKFLQFREVTLNHRVYEAVEIVEAPLKEHLKTLSPSEGLFFAGRFYRDFYRDFKKV
ncbi:hypothetical protein CrV_gp112 [Cylindrospermopsis raciborskii virus RM-2018a]|nr:hypothetical protein CrV_gp079 [Cylindrospermopsis raciborskii virus RM-2018a]AXK90522.1 hypothetical protein CrV_gp112 [Cylindrospermopsis raciborskii virus RM-2018a]